MTFRHLAILPVSFKGQPTFSAIWGLGRGGAQGREHGVQDREWKGGRLLPPHSSSFYLFGPEEGVLLDGPGAQCHTTLADGSLDEALVVGREGLQYTEVLSPTSPTPDPRLQGSAKDTPHVSSSPPTPYLHHPLPHLRGPQTCRETLAPPADSPKMVMLSGSPPKAAMFLFTQAMAMCWSRRP